MLILGCLGEPCPTRSSPDDIASEWEHGWYHNSAAALMEDGEVCAAIEEERLARRKHTGKFPFAAIRFCLEEAGAELDDVDLIAFGEMGGEGELRDPRISSGRIEEVLASRFRTRRPLEPRIRLVDHHAAHAMSAYGPSGFDEALVLTADGFGDGISGSVWEARGGRLSGLREQLPFECSLGRFYSSVLEYLGHGPGDEYKVMGLAAYGDPERHRELFAGLYQLHDDGRFSLLGHDYRQMTRRLMKRGPRRESGGAVSQVHMDVAAAMQEAYERLLLHVLAHHRRASGLRRLCLAGGTAQNSTANGKLLRSGLFDELYVQPAAHDAGIALGAAMHVQQEQQGPTKPRSRGPRHVYLGPGLPGPGALDDLLRLWQEVLDIVRLQDVEEHTAELLVHGEILGWVQGRSEFGPRALGNRSILADPRHAETREAINRAVKNREWYRPFAASVLEEDADEYFEIPRGVACLDFMTFVVPVRGDRRQLLAATTHVDGTARIQTVSRAYNERYWRLLKRFRDLTGLGVLLNTSFNNDAEPIVDSPDDAVTCLLTTDLDRAVIGDYVLTRRTITKDAYMRMHARLRSDVSLMRYWTCEPDETRRPGYAIARWSHKWFPISAATYAVLDADHRRAPVAAVLPASASASRERTLVIDELLSLWARRLIVIEPMRESSA